MIRRYRHSVQNSICQRIDILHPPDTHRPPDFLCIGAQRAGTTWLYDRLSRHVGIRMPPLKEIHYFDRAHPILAPGPEARPRPAAPDRPLRNRLARFRPERIPAYLRRLAPGDLLWNLRYYAGRRDDRWYASLFSGAGDLVTGEITPAYSALDRAGVEHAARLLPEGRIVFMMRDPVRRAWSHAVMDLTKFGRRPLAEVSPQDIIDHFHSHGSRVRGDYARTLDLWSAAFPGRLHAVFFDDVAADPSGVLGGVLEFLGVDGSVIPLSANREKVNAMAPKTMPRMFERELADIYLPELERLAGRLGGHAAEWYARAADAAGVAAAAGIDAETGRRTAAAEA